MVRKIIYITIILVFSFTPTFSQNIDSAGIISRQKSFSIVRKLFKDKSDFILFSITDRWYLIIKDCGKYYLKYYVDAKYSIVDESYSREVKIEKHNRILKKAFNSKIYHKGYVTFNSVFFKNKDIYSQGNITYFFLKKDDHLFGESRLSVFINPNPIDEDVYNYLKIDVLQFIQSRY